MEGSRVDAMMVFLFHVLIGKSSLHFGIVLLFSGCRLDASKRSGVVVMSRSSFPKIEIFKEA
jgi:hypothetical protein